MSIADENVLDHPRFILNPRNKTSRRSKGFFQSSPSSDLEEFLTGMEEQGKLLKRLANIQEKNFDKLSQWACNGDNTAIEDVSSKMRDLMYMSAERQKAMASEIERKAFKMRVIIEMDEKVKNAEKDVEKLRNKEKKLEKEMKKIENPGILRKKPDATAIRADLRDFLEVVKEKEKAEFDLLQLKKEMEVAKMFQFRKEMKGLSQSCSDFHEAASNIFKCNSELVELVPAISTEDVGKLKYEGGRITAEKVNQVRRSLGDSPPMRAPKSSRRKSAPLRVL